MLRTDSVYHVACASKNCVVRIALPSEQVRHRLGHAVRVRLFPRDWTVTNAFHISLKKACMPEEDVSLQCCRVKPGEPYKSNVRSLVHARCIISCVVTYCGCSMMTDMLGLPALTCPVQLVVGVICTLSQPSVLLSQLQDCKICRILVCQSTGEVV